MLARDNETEGQPLDIGELSEDVLQELLFSNAIKCCRILWLC